jgi:hypothetical protein
MARAKRHPSENRTNPDTEARRRFVAALARGRTMAKASAEAGVTPRTGHRWSRRPEIKAAIAELRQAALDRAAGVLSGAVAAAMIDMVNLRRAEDKPSEVMAKLSVCRAVLAGLLNIRGHVDLMEQNAEILRRLDEHDQIIKKRKLGGAPAFNGSR